LFDTLIKVTLKKKKVRPLKPRKAATIQKF